MHRRTIAPERCRVCFMIARSRFAFAGLPFRPRKPVCFGSRFFSPPFRLVRLFSVQQPSSHFRFACSEMTIGRNSFRVVTRSWIVASLNRPASGCMNPCDSIPEPVTSTLDRVVPLRKVPYTPRDRMLWGAAVSRLSVAGLKKPPPVATPHIPLRCPPW